MNKLLLTVICSTGIFVCGFLCCANIQQLVPTNEHYEAAWWKVGVLVLSSLVLVYLIKDNNKV